jgi:hypothetical protein
MPDLYLALLTHDGEMDYDGYARPLVPEHEWQEGGMPCVPMIYQTDNPPRFRSNTNKIRFPEHKGRAQDATGVALYDKRSGGEPLGVFRFGYTVTIVAGQAMSLPAGSLFLTEPEELPNPALSH